MNARQCDEDYPHEPHFCIRFIAGDGPPGPIPTTSHICPGRDKEAP